MLNIKIMIIFAKKNKNVDIYIFTFIRINSFLSDISPAGHSHFYSITKRLAIKMVKRQLPQE